MMLDGAIGHSGPQAGAGGIKGLMGQSGQFRDVLAALGPAIALLDPRNQQLGAALMQVQQGRQKQAHQTQQANATVEWLKGQGVGDEEARYLVSDNDSLREWYRMQRSGDTPDWQLSSIYDEQGREQKVMVDKRTGEYRPLGGAKSDTYSPAAEEQRVRIAQNSRPVTNLNVDTKGETKYDQTIGEGYGKRFLDTQNEAQAAQRTLNGLTVMESAISSPGFYSGAGSEFITTLKRIGQGVGLDPAGISSMETFNAMSKQAALDAMGGSLGAGFSNADRDFVIDQVPNLGNTPQGNRMLVDIQRKLNGRKIEIAGLARDYAARNGGRIDPGFDDFLSRWAASNPLFDASAGLSRGAEIDGYVIEEIR
jgi:hypothetical protein